ILQQRPSIVQTNSMLQKIRTEVFEHMTEFRGEVVHVCAWKILNMRKERNERNYQAVQTDKNE
ncbi:hypothetical protein, partial [Klebsiella pneumoniae]|uniref:hypothetical protein n=1 Tax=Klebsiella pneumoniae TaxID=573 RepID=UPI002731098D